FEEVEISLIYEDYATAVSLKQRARYGLTWWKHRRYLAGLLRRFQASTVASEQERQRLLAALPQNGRPIAVIPNCLDVAAYADAITEPQPNTLIYTGSFSYFPNHEAMLWFIREVWPLVQAEIPDAQLTITGNRAGKNLPDAPNVQHVGFVDDVRQYVAASWISLAPIWSGGGTRLKILEAMALRAPVIATSKGAEGIDAVPGEHILAADTAVDFAAETIRLLQSGTLRQKLTNNAYRLVCEKYDWTAVVPQLSDLLEQITHEND
ncbi:MAG TPA: glycosyltransferase, partial [Chloroflexi bacterium]|nr:glycosyltransferase [Chloroflexota bacterium]